MRDLAALPHLLDGAKVAPVVLAGRPDDRAPRLAVRRPEEPPPAAAWPPARPPAPPLGRP